MALVGAAVVGVTSLSIAKANSIAISSMGSNKVALQAQQYASAKGELIRATKYSDLTAQNKSDIGNTGFQDEVVVGAEQSVDSSTKKKEVTVNIYKTGESVPRSSLVVTRYNKEQASGGCQIVTGIDNVSFNANGSYKSVTVIVSSKFKPADSSWTGSAEFDVKVDGSLVGSFGTESITYKSGSRGHYWGTTEAVSNQVTLAANIVNGSTVSVNLGTVNRHMTSTVTVILGS